MDSPSALYALRWLIVDTLRQSLASRVFWIMLALSGLCTVFCLGVSIDGVGVQRDDWELITESGEPLVGNNLQPGRMSLLFGAVRVNMHRDASSQVRLLQTILGSWVGGSLGVLLALVLTAGFLPEFLQTSNVAVLLAKPTPRWLIVLGKFSGMVLFAGIQASVFFGGTWLALGLKTGVWHNGYLLGAPLFVVHFAAMYAMSVLLAVTFRSTTLSVLGVTTFWGLSYAVNYGRHATSAYPYLVPGSEPIPSFSGLMIEVAYWLLPKPADLTIFLEDVLQASADKVTLSSLPEFAKVIELGELHPMLAVTTSLAFCIGILLVAGHQLASTEY